MPAPVAALTATEPSVLVVDQFEELWTHCGPDDRATVLTALATVGPDVVVVLGLRADFYPAAAREPILVPILALGLPVIDTLLALDWVGQLEDGRDVLLVDLEKTAATPLIDALLLAPDPMVEKFRENSRIPALNGRELL